ncbi:hypothetical protein [Kistimonas asteriae]|uniref:hypothetical protein n=1 Tax=Kistimonas asteriae TaxID=517724 RepID=UPI001BAC4CC0|nr:hypothetical protein [Kistimonas asteriae]
MDGAKKAEISGYIKELQDFRQVAVEACETSPGSRILLGDKEPGGTYKVWAVSKKKVGRGLSRSKSGVGDASASMSSESEKDNKKNEVVRKHLKELLVKFFPEGTASRASINNLLHEDENKYDITACMAVAYVDAPFDRMQGYLGSGDMGFKLMDIEKFYEQRISPRIERVAKYYTELRDGGFAKKCPERDREIFAGFEKMLKERMELLSGHDKLSAMISKVRGSCESTRGGVKDNKLCMKLAGMVDEFSKLEGLRRDMHSLCDTVEGFEKNFHAYKVVVEVEDGSSGSSDNQHETVETTEI